MPQDFLCRIVWARLRSLYVILEVVTPVFRWQIRIRKEDLAYPVRVLHCYRLALSGLTGIVVELSEAQDVPGDFKEIGLSVLDRNRQGDGNFPSIVGCNAWLETRCEEKAVTFRSLPEHAAQPPDACLGA